MEVPGLPPHMTVAVGILALPILAALLYGLCGPPVSKPGPPLRNRDLRTAEWPNQVAKGAGAGWVFLTAEASHAHSDARFPGKLTGEAAGRSLWFRKGADESRAPLRGASPLPQALSADMVMDSKKKRRSLDMFTGLFGSGAGDVAMAPAPPFNPHVNPNASDGVLRRQLLAQWAQAGKPIPSAKAPADARDAARKGVAFYQMLQCEDGHWAGDYGGPHFLLPGFVIMLYITGAEVPQYQREGLVAYLRSHQQVDGGWGTHIEGASTMFGTVLSYVAMRLLGVVPSDLACVAARDLIRANGGALYTTSWAKFWLALLGLYEWRGIASIPPEMWLLPRCFPFHPGRMWCHARMVYLPMCYLYAKRFCLDATADPVLSALREELHCGSYEKISWLPYLHAVAPQDNYSPTTWIMKAAHWGLVVYETLGPISWLRDRGVAFAASYMAAEDLQTNYIDIGPVNKPLNMLVCWVEAGCQATEAFERHRARVDDYLWLAEDGLKVNGYNGSQCWDASFAIQGMVESGLAAEFPEMSRKVWSFLDRTQIKTDEEDREHWFRHISKGGWPFSTAAHGWPISDCTAEGLKGVLALRTLACIDAATIAPERLDDAVEVILSFQNHDGGWATYENNRGYGWYEWLNPSEAFGDIMIDYSYVECSSACVTALLDFQRAFPDHRAHEIASSVERGRRFLKSIQRRDGSWYGSWGVCFTYGTWFGLRGLTAAGEPRSSPSVVMAVKFLLSHQRENGGWGETYLSCSDKAYAPNGAGRYGNDGCGVVQTAWACLGLMSALMEMEMDSPAPGVVLMGKEVGGLPKRVAEEALHALRRGIAYLMVLQLETGDWAQESCTGVFNRSCAITYTAYRNIFPIWALGVYGKFFPKQAR